MVFAIIVYCTAVPLLILKLSIKYILSTNMCLNSVLFEHAQVLFFNMEGAVFELWLGKVFLNFPISRKFKKGLEFLVENGVDLRNVNNCKKISGAFQKLNNIMDKSQPTKFVTAKAINDHKNLYHPHKGLHEYKSPLKINATSNIPKTVGDENILNSPKELILQNAPNPGIIIRGDIKLEYPIVPKIAWTRLGALDLSLYAKKELYPNNAGLETVTFSKKSWEIIDEANNLILNLVNNMGLASLSVPAQAKLTIWLTDPGFAGEWINLDQTGLLEQEILNFYEAGDGY